MTLENEKLKSQLKAQEESKQAETGQIHGLRMTLSELECTKASLERELNALKSNSTSTHESLVQKVSVLNKTIEDIRAREKKLEDQRHNLELCLSNSQQEVKDLKFQLTGQDGKMGEFFATIARLEAAKSDLESKILNVASLLHHVRSSTSTSNRSRSRPSTPNRSSSRRGSSPWPPSSSSPKIEVDFDQIKSDIRDLMGRMSDAVKERDEALHHLTVLKRSNEALAESAGSLEDQVSLQKKKARSFEEQLKKLELKVAHSDANLADQVRPSSVNQIDQYSSTYFCLLIYLGGEIGPERK
jgi:chromosome segregation ATPase